MMTTLCGESLPTATPFSTLGSGALFETGEFVGSSPARKDLEQVEHDSPDFQELHVQLASLCARLGLAADSQRERGIILKLYEKSRAKVVVDDEEGCTNHPLPISVRGA